MARFTPELVDYSRACCDSVCVTAAEVESVPQMWDAALLATDLRLRFLAAHARLRQAQLILTHRDRTFPRTVDQCLNDAEREIAEALDELEGGSEWRDVERRQRAPMVYDSSVEPRNYVLTMPTRRGSTRAVQPPMPVWPRGFEKLSRRETVALLALGFTTTAIGAHLYLSADAVKSRLQQAYDDLGVSNQPHLVDYAWRSGLMRMPEIVEYQSLHRPPVPPMEITELPRRRQQLLVLLAAGYSQSEMAVELGLTALTVKSHLGYLYRSMGMKGVSAAGIVNRAWELGWLSASSR